MKKPAVFKAPEDEEAESVCLSYKRRSLRSSRSWKMKKLKVLCLHGFRTSGSILRHQFSKFGPSILDLLDMTYLDGPRPCGGPSMVEGYYPPPYYEWYLPNPAYTELVGLDACLTFLYNYIDEHGPFDGFMGFSQGACICAALVAMQQKGNALKSHPPIKFLIIVAGGMFEDAELKKYTYPAMISYPSIHITGAKDDRNYRNEALASIFENPIIIRHEGNHTVPRLGEADINIIRNFLLEILEQNVK